MKLGACESRAPPSVRALADDLPSTEVREGPVLVKGGAQEVVPGWVQTDACHCIAVSLGRGGRGGEGREKGLVMTNSMPNVCVCYLDGGLECCSVHVPHPNGGVRGR